MQKIFICSPYRGDIEKNVKLAKFAAKIIINCGSIPIVPHIYFTQILKDNDQTERIKGIEFGIELMKECDSLWIVGTKITSGMEYELQTAAEIKISTELRDEKLNKINPKNMILDARLDDHYFNIVKTLNLKKY